MKMIVGLGNPGQEYARTPHNAGYLVVNELARRWSASFRTLRRFDAEVAEAAPPEGGAVLLVKPLTFMNASGAAVAPLLRYRNGSAAELLVVADDADLEAGVLRLRPGGGSGGHRGLASVIENLGSPEFARMRIGIGRSAAATDLVEQVLRPLDAEAWTAMRETVGRAADAAACWHAQGLETAMNRFNGRPTTGAIEEGERA